MVTATTIRFTPTLLVEMASMVRVLVTVDVLVVKVTVSTPLMVCKTVIVLVLVRCVDGLVVTNVTTVLVKTLLTNATLVVVCVVLVKLCVDRVYRVSVAMLCTPLNTTALGT